MENSITVHVVTERVPSQEIMDRFGVKERSIRLARERGVFPASWYVGMRELCAKHSVGFSDELFNWKSPEFINKTSNAIKHGDASGECQEPAPGDAA